MPPSEPQLPEVPDQPLASPVEGTPPSGPLYAFGSNTATPVRPADTPAEQPMTTGEKSPSPAVDAESTFDSELPAYPPPPSFYQNMPAVPASRPIPTPRYAPLETPPQAPMAASWTSQSAPPGFAPPAFGPSAPALAPQKRSRTWIWIVISVLALSVVGGCGICGWVGYGLFQNSLTQATSLNAVTVDYLGSLQSQNYTQAYQDLQTDGPLNGLTLAQFTQQARSRDAQYGVINSYTIRTTSATFNNNSSTGSDINTSTIEVDVSRARLSTYTVLLTLRDVGGGTMKIINFDAL